MWISVRSILSLVEKEDLEFDLCSIFEPSMSVFAELFMEREKMKVRNSYLSTLYYLSCVGFEENTSMECSVIMFWWRGLWRKKMCIYQLQAVSFV